MPWQGTAGVGGQGGHRGGQGLPRQGPAGGVFITSRGEGIRREGLGVAIGHPKNRGGGVALVVPAQLGVVVLSAARCCIHSRIYVGSGQGHRGVGMCPVAKGPPTCPLSGWGVRGCRPALSGVVAQLVVVMVCRPGAPRWGWSGGWSGLVLSGVWPVGVPGWCGLVWVGVPMTHQRCGKGCQGGGQGGTAGRGWHVTRVHAQASPGVPRAGRWSTLLQLQGLGAGRDNNDNAAQLAPALGA